MIECTIHWICVLAICYVPIVMSMVPVVYNVHHPQCGETQYSNTQQLTYILDQVSRSMSPPSIKNDCDCIDILFTENPQLKAICESSTFIVHTFEQETTNEYQQLQAPPISEALMEVLQNISTQFKMTNPCTRINANSLSGKYSITTSNGSKVQV